MTPTLYRDTGYTLRHIVEEIEHGNIALPDIQRPFVWSSTKARDLFDSLYRGYPVGTLMFWETGADVSTRQVGGGDNDKVAKLLVVDGQQRLTSLYAVLTGRPVLTKSFDEKWIRIAFCPRDETFQVANAATKRDPEFIPDITALWDEGYRPTVRKFLAGLAKGRDVELTEEEEDRLEDRIDRVYDLQNFRFQVIELNAAAGEEQVAEIFVRINSEGMKLNQADFILTLMSVYWEKGRLQLEQFCRDAVDPTVSGPSPKNAFIDPSADQLVRAVIGVAFRRGSLRHAYRILHGKNLDAGTPSTDQRTAQFDKLRTAQDEVLDLTNWHEYLKCLTYAGFRSERMITSRNALICTYALWLIGRRDFGLDLKALRSVIARWFFMAHTAGRYTGSFESQFEADLGRITALEIGDGAAFCAELDRIISTEFTNDYWKISLPSELDSSSDKSPALSAYWAALNIFDAESLFSDLRIRDLLDPTVTAPRAIEQHHLFPKAYLAAKGVTARAKANAIANKALLDWPENATISADDPLIYWGEMTRHLDPERLERQRYWHALPVGWEQLDYPTFLERRRELIATVVRDGFNRLRDDKTAPEPSSTIAALLAGGESRTVEYKSTARLNLHTGERDKRMEHAITKTVCGFLNADGGTLLIGVDDNANILGLGADMGTLGSKANRDGYELFLRQHLDNTLSIPTAGIVRITFEQVGEADVCRVSVAASGKPVFAKPHAVGGQDPTEFWVRTGNATKQLHGAGMLEYQSNHWG